MSFELVPGLDRFPLIVQACYFDWRNPIKEAKSQ